VRPKLKSHRRAPNGTRWSDFLFGLVTKPRERALEPLAGSRFGQAQLLAGLGLGVAVDDDAQDEISVDADQAGQFGQQLSGRRTRPGWIGDWLPDYAPAARRVRHS